MAIDDRIVHLVRQEVDRVLTEADAGPESLHTELHALATELASVKTRLASVEARLAETETQAVPRTSRPRKTTAVDLA